MIITDGGFRWVLWCRSLTSRVKRCSTTATGPSSTRMKTGTSVGPKRRSTNRLRRRVHSDRRVDIGRRDECRLATGGWIGQRTIRPRSGRTGDGSETGKNYLRKTCTVKIYFPFSDFLQYGGWDNSPKNTGISV